MSYKLQEHITPEFLPYFQSYNITANLIVYLAYKYNIPVVLDLISGELMLNSAEYIQIPLSTPSNQALNSYAAKLIFY